MLHRSRRDRSCSSRSSAPALQGQLDTARRLHTLWGPARRSDAVMGPCRNAERLGLALQLRARRGAHAMSTAIRHAPGGDDSRNLRPEPRGETRGVSSSSPNAWHRPARHAADGGPSRPHRFARDNTCSAIAVCCSHERFLTRKSIRWRWAAMPITPWRCTPRRWPATTLLHHVRGQRRDRDRPLADRAWSGRQREGPRSIQTVLAATRALFDMRGHTTVPATAARPTRALPACCSTAAQTPTSARRSASSCEV